MGLEWRLKEKKLEKGLLYILYKKVLLQREKNSLQIAVREREYV